MVLTDFRLQMRLNLILAILLATFRNTSEGFNVNGDKLGGERKSMGGGKGEGEEYKLICILVASGSIVRISKTINEMGSKLLGVPNDSGEFDWTGSNLF